MTIGRKQLRRLLRIAAQLKENRYPNRRSLAAEFRRADIDENLNLACSTKTIQRDLMVLKEDFNCPLAFDHEQNGYYLKHHGWDFTCPTLYEEHEMLAAVLGARLAEEVFPEPLRGEVRQAVDFQLSQNNPDFLDAAIINSLFVIPGLKATINAAVFMTVFSCWQIRHNVEIEYRDINDQITRRLIEPHALVYYGTSWYVKARCLLRHEIRNFAIHRMVVATASTRDFEPDRKIINGLLDDKFLTYAEITDIKLLCDNRIRNFVEASPLHRHQTLEPCGQEHFLLLLPAMPEHEIIQWILYQAGNAQLLEPAFLRETINHAATVIATAHNGATDISATKHKTQNRGGASK